MYFLGLNFLPLGQVRTLFIDSGLEQILCRILRHERGFYFEIHKAGNGLNLMYWWFDSQDKCLRTFLKISLKKLFIIQSCSNYYWLIP